MDKELIEKLSKKKYEPKVDTYNKILHIRVSESQMETILHYFGDSGNVREFLVDSIAILKEYELHHKEQGYGKKDTNLPK